VCRQLYLDSHSIAVGELPNINGKFGCAVPIKHSLYASGVFSGTDFGSFMGMTVTGNTEGTVYGFQINFGENQYHNNVCPSIPAYLWQRTV
jgi:hypothetical protein